jgi:hypothetical protein
LGYQLGVKQSWLLSGFWGSENSDLVNLELLGSDKTPPWKSSLPSRIMTSDARLFRVIGTPLIDRSEIVPAMDLMYEFSDWSDFLCSLVVSGILDFNKKMGTL